MKLKEEQQRLKDLLKDTITLLCKNGVQYKDEISVEALIGITTDQEKVLLVNIKETIQLKTHNKNDNQKEGESGESDFEQVNTTKTRIIKSAKKRPHSVNDISDETVHKQQKFCPSISNVVSGDAVNMPPVKVKAEKEEDTDDLVFVKEELRNSFPAVNTSRQVVAPIGSVSLAGGSFSGAGPPTTLQSPLDGSSVQSPASAQSWNNPIRRMPYTPPGSSSVTCTVCNKSFQYKQSLQDHLRGTHNIGEPISCLCGAQFNWRSTYKQHKKTCSAVTNSSKRHSATLSSAVFPEDETTQSQDETSFVSAPPVVQLNSTPLETVSLVFRQETEETDDKEGFRLASNSDEDSEVELVPGVIPQVPDDDNKPDVSTEFL